jgi:hypothetical protein
VFIEEVIIVVAEFAVGFFAEEAVENSLFEPADAADMEAVD